ncbi:hypothetical protein E2C01_036750 [Portunus trituberculatus]|uniref:Uncharacterized protein n=1 Tax=Portunus trituberculatus TaxID=210409 RepID=A0A5B7FDA8_PORTR|nr:hypothetical protein [Portunus trituberculatus]
MSWKTGLYTSSPIPTRGQQQRQQETGFASPFKTRQCTLNMIRKDKGLPIDTLPKNRQSEPHSLMPTRLRLPKHCSDQQINDSQLTQKMYASHDSSRRQHFTLFTARSRSPLPSLPLSREAKIPLHSRFAPSLLHLINFSLFAGL